MTVTRFLNLKILDELAFSTGKTAHAQQNKTMFEPGNVGVAKSTLLVPDWNFNGFKVKFVGTKYQVKIPKWIEIPKIGPVPGQFDVIFSE